MKKIKKFLGDLAVLLGSLLCFLALKEADDHTQVIWGLVILGAAIITYLNHIRKETLDYINQKVTYHACEFTKSFIHAHDFDHTPKFNLVLEASIPFTPQVGMNIMSTRNDGVDIETGKLIEIDWIHGTFYCKTEPFKLKAHDEIMKTIDVHERYGWRIPLTEFELKEEYHIWKKQNLSTELN